MGNTRSPKDVVFSKNTQYKRRTFNAYTELMKRHRQCGYAPALTVEEEHDYKKHVKGTEYNRQNTYTQSVSVKSRPKPLSRP